MTAARSGGRQRVAIIDCGTNTIRLLVAEPYSNHGLVEQDRRAEIVRLGQGIDATGQFHPDALQRTFAAAERYADVIEDWCVPAGNVRFLATSASRDAGNRDEFLTGIRKRLGVTPEVITGDREASYSFRGALSGIAASAAPILVTDLGGGSTELILGDRSGAVTAADSLDVGSVRLTERFWTADPPTGHDLTEASTHIDAVLGEHDLGWDRSRTWIGVAGTLTTLAALNLRLSTYDRAQVHGHVISTSDLEALYSRLSTMPADAIRQLPTMPANRADVITAGALIATRIAHRLDVDCLHTSESDILDGAALDLLAE